MKIPYPRGIRETASRFGCDLPAEADLSRFGRSRSSRFGFELPTKAPIDAKANISVSASAGTKKRPAASTTPAPVIEPVNNAPAAPVRTPFDLSSRAITAQVPIARKATVTARPVALALPVTIDPKTALAVADKLLGDTKVSNGSQVVQTTMEIAKLPQTVNVNEHIEAIKRGAAVIDAAIAIREQTGAAPGQPAIPITSPGEQGAVDAAAAASGYTLTDTDLAALDAMSAQQPEHKNLWQRLFSWLASLGD